MEKYSLVYTMVDAATPVISKLCNADRTVEKIEKSNIHMYAR